MILYTLPNCVHCKHLKDLLRANKIEFEEKLFDTPAQTDAVMNNIYDDPPLLTDGDKYLTFRQIEQAESRGETFLERYNSVFGEN